MSNHLRIAASGGTPSGKHPDCHLALMAAPDIVAEKIYHALEQRCLENPHYPDPRQFLPRSEQPDTADAGRQVIRGAYQLEFMADQAFDESVRGFVFRQLGVDCLDVHAVFEALGKLYVDERYGRNSRK
ncbi:hypothetical protein HY491_03430 [Candidatus Woesearchaeota archaeon]|nr:hypothetical protein [Candidatus Woesearchaeota archaeon]